MPGNVEGLGYSCSGTRYFDIDATRFGSPEELADRISAHLDQKDVIKKNDVNGVWFKNESYIVGIGGYDGKAKGSAIFQVSRITNDGIPILRVMNVWFEKGIFDNIYWELEESEKKQEDIDDLEGAVSVSQLATF
ncbi:MAG: hypothetical protein ACFFG0_47440 [Candidatus Thorarchaeota archaeon]